MDPKRQAKLQAILNWQASKPTTNSQWSEDAKAESLCFKFDYQLDQMAENLTVKLPRINEDLDMFINWPDVVRYKLNQHLKRKPFVDGLYKGKTLKQWIDEEFNNQLLIYDWKKAKIQQSINRIEKEIALRKSGFLEVLTSDKSTGKFDPLSREVKEAWLQGSRKRAMVGTTYYVDSTGGNDGNDGLGTGTAWANLDTFTEAARSAGDICILRRGLTGYDNGSDLLFTSDGTITDPITIEADYDDAWTDFANSAQTYTPVFGSKTMTASATITGIAAGDWIYNSTDSDDPRKFAYEVASVSGTTLTLKLPFKGSTGSTKTLKVMPDAPKWNSVAGDFQVNQDTDDYWLFRGIHFAGTDANGVIEIDSSIGTYLEDCIVEGDAGTSPIEVLDSSCVLNIYKTRFFNGASTITAAVEFAVDQSGFVYIKDSLITGSTYFIQCSVVADIIIEESEAENTSEIVRLGTNADYGNRIRLRNVIVGSGGHVSQFTSTMHRLSQVFIEDYDGTPNDTRYLQPTQAYFGGSADQPTVQSDTGTVRSGGSNKSLKVTPHTGIDNNWFFSMVKVLEIPIYATTASKTYDIYLRPTATTDWTADPTAAELWLEAEYWGHASNNFRKITKSTGVIDMNGSTAWQALSVTVAPAQAGVLYLRLWYGKPKESAKANTFYIDPIPVIT